MQYFKKCQLLIEYIPILIEQLAVMNRITLKEELVSLCETLYLAPKRIDLEIVLKRMQDNFLKSVCWRRRCVFIKVTRLLIDYISFGRYR
jgi:hypothetical protein